MTRDMKPRILFASSHENRAEKNSAIQALRLMAEFKTLLKPVLCILLHKYFYP